MGCARVGRQRRRNKWGHVVPGLEANTFSKYLNKSIYFSQNFNGANKKANTRQSLHDHSSLHTASVPQST